MRKIFWLFGPCAALLIGVTTSGTTQPAPARTLQGGGPVTYASVYGIVTDSLGRPIPNAIIEIGGRLPFSTIIRRTSATGEFWADSLVAGDVYTVAAMRLGYRATESQPFTAVPGVPRVFPLILKARATVTIPGGIVGKKVFSADSVSKVLRARAD